MDSKIPPQLRVKLKAHLKKPLQRIIKRKNMDDWVVLVEDISKELGISTVHCAAAFAQLNESNFQRRSVIKEVATQLPAMGVVTAQTDKMIPYRLEIGFNQQVSIDALKQFLVDEAGVERDKIEIVEFLANHTRVNLPEGMPNDIFQHLKSACLNRRALKITCLGVSQGVGKSFKSRPNRRSKKHWNKGKGNPVKEER
ncbi:MAG: DbpA RNA binding domain-containing protein [Methylococcales bacterium]|jgi:hypothetical protein|nr:hypothetical protein [Methylococcaceae bacterium]HIL39145.1 hypothetical protein [Methylococcales bacterium]